ncbi:methyltransferase family protein [Candidatus Palauibacter sp.]|uniref:methyltransferase family protein n=1 Tax=Candidatus Palauibacter sp. TaxID=3101350 RepID=UPI003AF2FA22
MKLFLKSALFTLVAPGTFAGVIPFLLARDRTAGTGATLVLASLLFAAGVALYLRCAWDFAAFGRGTPAPIDQPKRLVTRGPYRFTRNPMYVAVMTVISAWAILFGGVLLWTWIVVAFVIFSQFIRHYEEPHLTRKFGEEYIAYMERVGRWLPPRVGRGSR